MNNKAFTLIEVLVASSVLFIVTAAVVGLSNSIIQSTSVTADSTSANRLATEGLELIVKIRDDKVKNAIFYEGKFIWFNPVEFSSNYGWYTLEEGADDLWTLNSAVSSYSNVIDITPFSTGGAEAVSDLVGLVDYYRLICIEAIAAENDQKDDLLNCNTADEGEKTKVVDGVRNVISACYADESSGQTLRKDIFCEFTEESLNRNIVLGNKKIPDGNAVKIRSVVLWNDKDVYRYTEIATILTNWQSFAQ